MNFEQLKNFLAILAVLMLLIQLSTCGSAFAKSSKSTGSSARSAVTGKYVSKSYATKNPKTTVIEKRKSR